jgi:DNA-directed RNA polymerase subunit M/transcription elongation factor TFIIS
MTVKCLDCGYIDDNISIQEAGIVISRTGRFSCAKCGSKKIGSMKDEARSTDLAR